jgi:hypothetical protein
MVGIIFAGNVLSIFDNKLKPLEKKVQKI